jgi:hypothetical protein
LKDDTLIVWQVWEWKAEREYAEMGGGSKQQKLGLGTEKETRSTYRRTLPRPHVRRIYQVTPSKSSTLGGVRKLSELITVSTSNAWHCHITAPEPYLALPIPSGLMIELRLALVLSVLGVCVGSVRRFVREPGLANEGSRGSLAVANPSNVVRGRHWVDWVEVHK